MGYAKRHTHAKLDATLKGLGFQQSAHEHTIYARSSGSLRLLVGVYVDDVVVTGSVEAEIGRSRRK